MQINSESSEDSEKTAAILGSNLVGGEVIELVSDVGGGKTTFTRGIVKGTGSTDHVSSPTFTISNRYHAPQFQVHHFDFYRLHEAGLIEHELKEVLDGPNDVVIVEWSDVVKHVLPKDRLQIHIRTTGEHERTISFACPKKLDYLLKGITRTVK